MTEKAQLSFDCAEAAQSIRHFAVGFAVLTKNGREEDAFPAGSGTLAKLGPISGIVTAAHVLKALPDKGEVGLVRFNSRGQVQKQTIEMSHAEKVIISAGDGPLGPDLGFLQLPPVNGGNLEATNNFFNLGKRREAHAAPMYFEAVVGVVGEWTADVRPTSTTRRKDLELLFGGGQVTGKSHLPNGFDLCTFKVDYAADVKKPSTYKGVSGGGLWRVYYQFDAGERQVVREKRLVGVAFYEFTEPDGSQMITCHGPRSIYRHLVERMQERWPECRDGGRM